MRRDTRILTPTLVLAACVFALGGVTALADDTEGQEYEVTITNVTRGQVVTPPVVIVHDARFALFTPGMPASAELAALAEDGDTVPLEGALSADHSVRDVAVGGGPLMPGESMTLMVRGGKGFRRLTATAMLASSNDAFFAVRGARIPGRLPARMAAYVWDAGSEGNSEFCEHVPGPPCGNAGVRNTATAEGFVHIHAGIHGISDLVPEMHDWRNPAVMVSIKRLR
jgi:hypothetical protein